MYSVIFIYLIFIILITCDDNSDVRYYYTEKEKISSIASNNKSIPSNELTCTIPEGWLVSNGSTMRLASYNVPFNGGIGDLSVIRLGGDAGGIVANVNRWRGQLNLPPMDQDKISNITNIANENKSKYRWFKIINETAPSSAFLCAILPENNTTLFIKLNIPISAIEEIENQFLEFCSSIIISE